MRLGQAVLFSALCDGLASIFPARQSHFFQCVSHHGKHAYIMAKLSWCVLQSILLASCGKKEGILNFIIGGRRD